MGKSNCEKDQFYNEMACLGDPRQIILDLRDFNRHFGGRIEGFTGVHGGHGDGERNVGGRRLLEFCDEKECVANA